MLDVDSNLTHFGGIVNLEFRVLCIWEFRVCSSGEGIFLGYFEFEFLLLSLIW